MLSAITRKNKVNISDYPYKKDIINRLFLADLTTLEIEVLKELLFQPSKCRIADILDCVSCDQDTLFLALETFSRIGLTMRQGDLLFIDKELRKYFEFHLVKFANKQAPSFESLQGLLNKVPISILPTWYSIPRSSDNIFDSIVEKYLHTPKIYENYLKDLIFEDVILNKIVEELFASSDLTLDTATLRERYKLTREKLQEYILLLEFHFVAVSSYQDGKERITPFAEWGDLLRFQKKHKLEAVTGVTVTRPPVNVATRQDQEVAMNHFRATIDDWYGTWSEHVPAIEKAVYEIEKGLKNAPQNSWILFEQFLAGLLAPLGQQGPVTLVRTGKKWRYSLPSYSDKEKSFIECVVLDLLHKVGITTTGEKDGKPCFMITPYGRVALGD